MLSKPSRRVRAYTLVEVMVSAVILSIAVMGTSGYRYYASLDSARASAITNASAIGVLLCENWSGVKGSSTYNPASYFGSSPSISNDTTIQFTSSDPIAGPAVNAGFTLLGTYKVVAGNYACYAVLSWKDVGSGLKLLNVIMAWSQRNKTIISESDLDKTFTLTTYTMN